MALNDLIQWNNFKKITIDKKIHREKPSEKSNMNLKSSINKVINLNRIKSSVKLSIASGKSFYSYL